MSNHFEIEIKTLLGSENNALKLKEKIKEKGGVLGRTSKELNHYFIIKDINQFKNKLLPYISEQEKDAFNKILDEGSNFSIRTRSANNQILLVIKSSIGSDTSSNGVSRMEFESAMDMTLDELDKLLLESGLEYQAKWSREREEYDWGDIHICLDKNAGYGYLAEFEKVVNDKNTADATKSELLSTMADFSVEELPQDRLERMFAHYNSNWRDYYGTDKVFNIE